MYQFTPPVAYYQPFSERSPLWSRIRIPVPYTVVKTDSGAYIQELEHNPDRAGIAVVYEGGHVYVVTDEEAALLIAAGYAPTPLEVDLGNGYIAAVFEAFDLGNGYADVTGTELDRESGYSDFTA